MKKTYLKPTADLNLIYSEAIMITVSGEGQQIVDDGGSTSGSGITEGDSRGGFIWDDED